MKVQFKKLNDKAVIPTKTHKSDAGFDIIATSDEFVQSRSGPFYEYGTGLAILIPEGYVGKLYARSGITSKTTLSLGNSCGILDSGYTGEVKFQFRTEFGFPVKKYEVGDRIGQLIIQKLEDIQFEEIKELPKTERGSNGHGSSGV